MNCPRSGKECYEFMCGNSINGICQENKIQCDFCNEIHDEICRHNTFSAQHWIGEYERIWK